MKHQHSSHNQSAARLRRHMVKTQIAGRDVRSAHVLRAMESVPRHEFLPGDSLEMAYEDCARPIGGQQTCSQPYIVAHMSDWAAIRPHDRVLEIGTGCGYQAAVAAQIAAEVFTVERQEGLARAARERLSRLGYHNVRCFRGDGYQGMPEFAPFDVILITAGAPRVPAPLLAQLADNGRLVGPVGDEPQQLLRVTRTGRDYHTEYGIYVRFVPFLSPAFAAE